MNGCMYGCTYQYLHFPGISKKRFPNKSNPFSHIIISMNDFSQGSLNKVSTYIPCHVGAPTGWTKIKFQLICHHPAGPPFRPARCVVFTMPPKKRTSGGGGSQAAPERSKKGAVQELPGVPPDALKLPHMNIFDTWWFL